MAEDLLRRIRREMHERLEELRGSVDERDRLQADLRALDAGLKPAASTRRSSVGCEPERKLTVSPKVVRLMHAPRRPSLERSGAVRVGLAYVDPSPEADSSPEVSSSPEVGSSPEVDPADGVDRQAELYERSI
jgi:hypothetical protein